MSEDWSQSGALAIEHIVIVAGVSFSLPYTFATGPDAASAVAPADWLSWSAEAQVRGESGDLLLTLTCQLTAGGVLTVSATAAETRAIRHRRGTWDLLLTRPDGFVYRFVAGDVVIGKAVTQ